MPSAGDRPFLLPFCGRLDKKEGVWRDATRRLVHAVGDKEVGGPVSQGVVGAGEGGCRGDLELGGEFFW